MSNSRSLNLHPDGTLFIVSGPSGAGKTTLIERARAEIAALGIPLHFSVSHTTRSPRIAETEGCHYHFVRRDQFVRMVEREEFIEWAHVHGQMYGTSKAEVQTRLDRGEDVVLDIDVQGARIIAKSEVLRSHSLSVFVFPPSFDELQSRLERRGFNSKEEIDLRLEKAMGEIEEGLSFYDTIIINDDFEVAAQSLKAAMIARKLNTNSARARIIEMARQFKEAQVGRAPGGY